MNSIFFIVTELLLYFSFLWLDKTGEAFVLSNTLKFISIVLCFLFIATRNYPVEKSDESRKDVRIITLALFFTVLADICLLLFDYYLLGMLFFNIVQLIYFYRLRTMGRIKNLSVRISVMLVAFAIFFLSEMSFDVLLFISVIYFVNIFFNMLTALQYAICNNTRRKHIIIFAVGMVLFFLCDINVGIYNISGYISLESSVFDRIYQFSTWAMWFFYLPSQIIIVCSSKNMGCKQS